MTDIIEWGGVPGPWKQGHHIGPSNRLIYAELRDGGTPTIATVFDTSDCSEETHRQYVLSYRAIAEVPAMVQALRAIVHMQPRTFAQDHWFQKARAILARIDGGVA
jgi:hypothetical protein